MGSDRAEGAIPRCGEIYRHWKGNVWFIEADIRGCFDHIDHEVLVSILREKVLDRRFVRLIEGFLSTGYLEEWRYHDTRSGTPQGAILSPVLANIYLDRLDVFVESILRQKYDRGDERKPNPEYSRLVKRAWYLKTTARHDQARAVRRQMQRLPSYELNDPDYRRLKYVRYADDILLGFVGPRCEAEEIRQQLAAFLRDRLRLELSDEKTRIIHARSEKARFLGYDLTVGHDDLRRTNGRRSINGTIGLRVPRDVVVAKCRRYQRNGVPVHRPEMAQTSALEIVGEYQKCVPRACELLPHGLQLA